MTSKVCRDCGVQKDVADFHVSKGNKDGLRAECKECKKVAARKYYQGRGGEARRKCARDWYHANKDAARAKHAAWREKNPLGHRRSYYRALYGITPEDRAFQVSIQNGKCLLCYVLLATLPERHVHIDHCHSTGAPRGILCHWCNTQLGSLEKAPDWISRATQYLTKGGAWLAGHSARKAAA